MLGISRKKSALLLLTLIALSGCAISDVGEVDARKIKVTNNGDDDSLTYVGNNKYGPLQGQSCNRFFGAPTAGTLDDNAKHSNLVGLGRPRVGSSALKAGDMVSVRLRQAYISNNGYTPENAFSDFDLSAEGLGETTRYISDGFSTNLEVLVAARMFDYGGEADSFQFGAPGRQASRVIYFNDDVDEDQFLSLDNLPIYGPLEYSGAGFGLQLFILEVDDASEQQKELLNSLAAVGTAAAAGAAPVINVLSSLTEGLLTNGNQDDRMFDYAIGFDTGFEGAT
ncbi:MAG: hypothetical protein AAFV54_10920, partial [Pseudomonadota bacterium]